MPKSPPNCALLLTLINKIQKPIEGSGFTENQVTFWNVYIYMIFFVLAWFLLPYIVATKKHPNLGGKADDDSIRFDHKTIIKNECFEKRGG